MKDGDLIKALGGYRAVARLLGITDANALHFERRVIPWKYRPKLKAAAQRRKIKLPPDFLETQRAV